MSARITEVRYDGNRFRMFTVVTHSSTPALRSVQIAWGVISAYGGVAEFVKRHGLRGLVSCAPHEKWHHDIAREQARAKASAWRKSAARAGLSTVGTFDWNKDR